LVVALAADVRANPQPSLFIPQRKLAVRFRAEYIAPASVRGLAGDLLAFF
jgi:hypothetical protein